MKMKIILAIALSMLLSGCINLFGPDKEGWKSVQKREFLSILERDDYMSLCNQKRLYKEVQNSRDSVLMTKLLTAYANNLANSCIDLKRFAASQRAKKAQKIDTHFSTYQEKKISSVMLQNKLRAGMSIQNILRPYVPTSPQFLLLRDQYRGHKATASKKQLKRLRLNIERSKLMNPKLGTHYALVNIPEYKVRMIENGKTALSFAVIVGKTNMQTPVFSENLKYVVINPQWNVPDSIMRKSYIPKIKANPGWVAYKGMEIHRSYDLSTPKINPASVDWSKYPKEGKGHIPYKLIQVPSLKNGLGRVKFIFPNRYAVYMHDTQNKSLFKRKTRAFSHGCVRLGKPMTLLHHIAKNYTRASLSDVNTWYKSLKTKYLNLSKPLQVHIVYFTAYVDGAGKLHQSPDIYGFDKSQHLNFK